MSGAWKTSGPVLTLCVCDDPQQGGPGWDSTLGGRLGPTARLELVRLMRVDGLSERQAADIVQPDITICGGLLETKKIAAWAESYYVRMAPHNVGVPISTAAALHLASTMPNFKIQEHFNDFADDWVKQAAPGLPEVVEIASTVPSSMAAARRANACMGLMR